MNPSENPTPHPEALDEFAADASAADQASAPAPLDQAPPPPADNVFWGWHDVFMFAVVTALALGITMLGGIALKGRYHISEVHMNIVFIVAQFFAYGASFACLKVMFQAEYGAPLLASLNWRPSRIDPARLIFVGLAQAFTIALIGTFMNIPQTENPMNRLLSDRPTAFVIALLGVTVAPLAEELAFRGLLQPLLIRTIGVVPGILATSILFGAMHLEQYGAWQSVVLITLAGAGFGAMRHWTGSTRASTIMHAGYNSALFILFFAQKGTHS
jgi:membrane protease YdiL (CAAX protease family)